MALRSFAGGRVFANVHGEGVPRVVALHGWGRRGADFDRVLGGLPAIAVDLPGFGASPEPAKPLGSAGYAEMLAEVMGETEAPILVGHSFGGRIALRLAAAHKVAGLVLTGVPLLRTGVARKPSMSYRLLRSANRWGLVGDERMERIRRSRGSADYRAASGVMRDTLVKAVNESYATELADLEVPVLLVWGQEDREVPLAVAEQALSLLKGGELIVLPGVGHHVPLEAPGDLRAAIDRMLAP